jgi:predicted nucleotidyltransferase
MGRLDDIVRRIRQQKSELRRRGIQLVAIFGSAARGDDRPDSDVAIAVDIIPGKSFSLIGMEDTRLPLEDVLGQPVDMGEVEQLRPPVRASFERERPSSASTSQFSDGA